MIEIRAVGGYNEIGKNLTAVNVDGEVVIFDMGLHLERYIHFTEENEKYINDNSNDSNHFEINSVFNKENLLNAGAIADVSKINAWKNNVKAIIPTHAHLDHIGAIPYLANDFEAPILCTHFTSEVIKTILRDDKINLNNQIKVLNDNSHYKISEDLEVEFIRMTHSTPQTVFAALHTKYGIILYANDFKFDLFPVIGKKPDFARLKQLGDSGKVIALICDSTCADSAIKTPSESVAQQMLKDVLHGIDSFSSHSEGKAIIITTFSSHIARLKSIVKYAKQIDRKVLFMGRSLGKYIKAAEKIGLVNFSKTCEIVSFPAKIERKLRKISKTGKDKFLLVVTGHQGEDKSVLSKMLDGRYPFEFEEGDHVIFSSRVIPTQANIEARELIDEKLESKGVRLFKDIHVSGHAGREDIRDLISFTKPKYIIPAHGDSKKKSALADLGVNMNYEVDKNVILLNNGDLIELKVD